MDEAGVAQSGSIINYFQRQKSPTINKSDSATKQVITHGTESDDKDYLDISEKSQFENETKNNEKINECKEHNENMKKVNCVDTVSNTGESNVPSDVIKNYCNEKKTKWSFSWQGKAKKTKAVVGCPDSDSDFDTVGEASDAKSKLCNFDEEGNNTNLKKKKSSRRNVSNNSSTKGIDSNPDSTHDSDAEHCDETIESSKLQAVLSLNNSSSQPDNTSAAFEKVLTNNGNSKLSNNRETEDLCEGTSCNNYCISKTASDPLCLKGFTETMSDSNSGNDIKEESRQINIRGCDVNKECIKSPGKMNYFDILMQSSKTKAFEKQISADIEVQQEKSDDNCCEQSKESKVHESSQMNRKKGKMSNEISKGKNIGCNESSGSEISCNDVILVSPPKTQNKRSSRNTKSDQNKTEQKCVRKSTRRKKSIDPVDNVGEFKEVKNQPLKQNHETKKSDEVKLKKSLVENSGGLCCDRIFESAETMDHVALPEGNDKEDCTQSKFNKKDRSTVKKSDQSHNEVKDMKEDNKDIFTKKKRRESRRFRKNCILDSDDEEDKSTEVKSSISKTSKKDGEAKKGSDSIAPIFLPGAWRRAKAKLEEAEKLEAKKDIVEIQDDSSALAMGQSSNVPIQDDKSSIPLNSSENSLTNNDLAISMAVFASMFKQQSTKPVSVVVHLIEAPFPKVSHVQQQEDGIDHMWKLPMVRNNFVKEEFFIMPDLKCSVERNLSRFTLLTSCYIEAKTAVDSKRDVLPEMNKTEKQMIISYLKTIYQGVPMKKLYKRCQHQLELCQKSLIKSDNSLFRKKQTVNTLKNKNSLLPNVAIDLVPPASNSTKSATTELVLEKNESFTKISKRKSKGKGKLEPKKVSPLLQAFKKQEDACNNKKGKVVKAKLKKEPRKKTSIVDFMAVQTQQTENIPENKTTSTKNTKSKKQKKLTRKITDMAESKQTEITESIDKKKQECKKRIRETEDEMECYVEDSSGHTVKKAKMFQDTQELKKPRKGQKRKVQNVESQENADVAEIRNDRITSLERSSKCRKILSDDDLKKSCQEESKTKVNNEALVGGETKCLRKSLRLRKKNAVEETGKQEETKMDEMEICEGKSDDTVEIYDDTKKDSSHEVGEVKNRNTAVIEEKKAAACEVGKDFVANNIVKQSSSCESTITVDTGRSVSSLLWSECFKPRNSMEILGNNSCGTKLRNWLSEWKTLRERKLEALKRREEKKRLKLAAKKCGKETSSWLDDDESDFYSSDDNDSDADFGDEENTCNTMLLSGPVGSGKTSAVYACAEELGFKVIEVNSSTKRGGKYILTELLEATQSHQVSTKHSHVQPLLCPQVNSELNEKKSENLKRSKKSSKKRSKKKTEELSKESELQGPMSVILLDEVDVLFEEDKGFWASVNTLRQNSKRPIVMTVSDLNAIEIEGEYEHMILKSPSLKIFAAYLQTVCLIKNVFVNPSDIQTLSWLNSSDIRRLLLSLQFWVDSNAGICDKLGVVVRDDIRTLTSDSTVYIPSKNNKLDDRKDFTAGEHSKDIREQSHDGKVVRVSGSMQKEDNCDVEIAKKHEGFEGSSTNSTSELCNKQRNDKNIKVDENKSADFSEVSIKLTNQHSSQKPGNPVSSGENKIDSVKACEGNNVSRKSSIESTDTSLEKEKAVSSGKIELHGFCLESLLGLRNLNTNTGGLLETLKSKNSFEQKCLVTCHCQRLKMDVVYCNLETLLPCLFGSVNVIPEDSAKTYPSSDSQRPECKTETKRDTCESSEYQNELYTENENIFTDRVSKKIAGISMACLEDFYEDMSFMDSELCCDISRLHKDKFDSWSAKISAGLTDSVVQYSSCETSWTMENAHNELRGALEIASLERSHKKYHDLCNNGSEQVMNYTKNFISRSCLPSDFDRPVTTNRKVGNSDTTKLEPTPSNGLPTKDEYHESRFEMTKYPENFASVKKSHEQQYNAISLHLPNYLNRNDIVMDYLPTLHIICKDQALRKSSRVKRRFYHYLDSIGLHIPSLVVQSLTQENYFN